MREPRDEEPPLPPVSPAARTPSRLRRTLHSLRAPFRPGSPFHIGGAHKRSDSNKSSASDGDLARDERTMRKRNKKTRELPADATLSNDSLPNVEKKKKDGFIRKMGNLTKKKVGETSSASSSQSGTKESTLERISPAPEAQTSTPETSTTPTSIPTTPTPRTPTPRTSTPRVPTPRMPISKTPSPKTPTPRTATPKTPTLRMVASKPPNSASPTPVTPNSASPTPASPTPVTPVPVTPTPVTPISETPPPVEASIPNTSPAEPEPTSEPHPPSPSPQTSEPVSPIAVTHPVATRPFTKAAWKRNSEPEIEKPVEEPSPGSALKRRIAFVDQKSAEEGEGEAEGGRPAVGSLEEAVALAREKLGGPAPPAAPVSPHAPDHHRPEDEMPPTPAPVPAPYGDLIEPSKPGTAASSHASPSAERREHLYKILVIGELGTGKTSIIKRYVHQFFSQHYRATIGVDFALKVLNWDQNTIIRLQLWDIAGQERFGNMTRVYYKEAVGAFIVFDVSRVATFDAVVKWKNDLDAKVQLPDGSPIPCILLANKCDQQKEGIVNSAAKMEEYCREKGFAGWFETSAKENINIEEAARSLVNKILLNDKLLQNNDRDGDKFALEHKIANGENSRDSTGKSCTC